MNEQPPGALRHPPKEGGRGSIIDNPSCPLFSGLPTQEAGGPQGSAAGGGVKRPLRLGRHLRLRKQRAAQMYSANPDAVGLEAD